VHDLRRAGRWPVGDLLSRAGLVPSPRRSGCPDPHAARQQLLRHDLRRDGGECFTAFSHDVTVPVEATTWGGIRGAFGR
jgi:hypothetical protein